MTKFVMIMFVFGLFISCDTDKISKPENLIPESKMVDIIVDLTMMNSGQGLNKAVLEKEGIVPEEYVYTKYGIDSVQFINSNEYYAHNIDTYQDIYANVKLKLTSKKEFYKKLNEEETKAKKKQDSINAIKKRQIKDSILGRLPNEAFKKISIPGGKVD